MKESPHITLTKEQDKRETVQCIVWASVVVFGMLALLLHGLAFFEWTEPTMTEVYARKRMQNQIEDLYQWRTEIVIDYGKHTHRFWNGKIKQETVK